MKPSFSLQNYQHITHGLMSQTLMRIAKRTAAPPVKKKEDRKGLQGRRTITDDTVCDMRDDFARGMSIKQIAIKHDASAHYAGEIVNGDARPFAKRSAA